MANTRADYERIHKAAMNLVTLQWRAIHDAADTATAKAWRTAWQRQLMENTGCTHPTARSHIAKALRLRRGEYVKQLDAEPIDNLNAS